MHHSWSMLGKTIPVEDLVCFELRRTIQFASASGSNTGEFLSSRPFPGTTKNPCDGSRVTPIGQ